MSWLSHRWNRLLDWCAEDEPADALAWFRISVALICLVTWVEPLLSEAWWIFVAESHGGFASDLHGPVWWRDAVGSTATSVPAVLIGASVCAVLMALGIGGRWMVLLQSQFAILIFALHPGTGGGHDRLITNALWLLFLSGCHLSWSVPVWRRTGSWRADVRVSSWPRRLAIWQLLLMYVLTGLQKQGDAWDGVGDYRALYDTFQLPSWAKFDMTWVAHVFPLTQFATIVAWWWETLFIVLLVWYAFRRPAWRGTTVGRLATTWDLRVPFVLLGIVTHGTLWVVMNLGPFSPITFAYYLCLWTEADTNRWFVRRESG